MSVILVVYEFGKVPSHENEDILFYLAHFPELVNREYKAPAPLYVELGKDGDLLLGLLIRVNDETIRSDTINILVRYTNVADELSKARFQQTGGGGINSRPFLLGKLDGSCRGAENTKLHSRQCENCYYRRQHRQNPRHA